MEEKQTVFYTLNAKTQQPLATPINTASPEEVEQALSKADEARIPFAETAPENRIALLKCIQKGLKKNKAAIVEGYCQESGLPEGRAKGEFQRTLGQIEHFIPLLKQGRFLHASLLQPSQGGPDIRKIHYPIGPVVVFGASNFPLAFSTAGGDTISALAAGCPVIVKAHPYHAGTSSLVAQVITKAVLETYLPEGVFSHLCSTQHDLGQQLVQDARIQGVGFTGSYTGGKALYDLAQQRQQPIPVFAEMGSVNPVFLLPELLRKQAEELAEELAQSITLGNGQFCTNPGLIALVEGESHAFIDKLKTTLTAQPKGVMVHPNIQKGYEAQLEYLRSHYPELKFFQAETGAAALGIIKATAVLENPALMEEVFGPFTLVVLHTTPKEILQTAKALKGQLTATIRGETSELEEYKELQYCLQQKVGRLLFKGVPTGVSVSQTMMHGGPFPASSDCRFTAVGSDAIYRWLRPLAFQDAPQEALPAALQNHNPLNMERKINGQWTTSEL